MEQKRRVEFRVPKGMGVVDVILAVQTLPISGEGPMEVSPVHTVWRPQLPPQAVSVPEDIELHDVIIRFIPG